MKKREFFKLCLSLTLLAPMYLTQICFAATHYVTPGGTDTWTNSTNISTPCSIATADANAAAGDLIYLRGGTYSFSQRYATALAPRNSGTSGAWITYKSYPNETPEFVGTYKTRMWGLAISNQGYIIVDGIIFSDFSDHIISAYAHHIEVKNCTFRNATSPYRGGGFFMVPQCLGGSAYNCPTHDLWIHHNTFYKLAAGGGCSGGHVSEGGDAVRIGFSIGTGGQSNIGIDHHITIENNYIAYAGHTLFDSYGENIVFNSNILHNEPWYPADNGACHVSWPATGYTNAAYNGLYGHRVMQMTDSFNHVDKHNILEGNRLGYGSINPNNDGADAIALAVSGSIFRYNALYGAMNNGLLFKYGNATYYGAAGAASGGNNNRVYNNTIYSNGYGYPYYHTCTLSVCPEPQQGIHYYAPAYDLDNVVKNNIVYGNARAVLYGGADIQAGHPSNTVTNNWLTSKGYPKFVNPDLTQTTSLTLPDLNLQAGSGAIDKGTYLTTAKGAGTNSTTLVVADALYFQDGTWGAEMTHGVTLFPDWIAIGTVGNVVQISAINYTINTITLASPMSWSKNAPIWLYKKSDGKRVLYGTAPDLGAYEYQELPSPN